MELENLKQSWQEYDKKLEENLKLNETLLRQLNLDKSKREMNKPYVYEITNILAAFGLALYMLNFSVRTGDQTTYIFTALGAIVIDLIFLFFSIDRLRAFSKVNYVNAPVVEVQRAITLVKKKVLHYRKIELWLVPAFMFTILPVIFLDIKGIALFDRPGMFIFEMLACCSIALWLISLIYKHLYQKKLENTELFLKEIEEYEK